MRRASAIACLWVCAALAGCGSSSHPPVDPEATLDAAFAHPVRSADVAALATVRVHGSERLADPLRLRLDGPYDAGSGTAFPSFAWRASASALGFPVGGHVTSTGDNVYLTVYGEAYQLGFAPPPPPELDVRGWFGRARQVGEGNQGGVDCARIQAPLRGGRVAADLQPLLARLGSTEPATVRGTAQACVGFDDHALHELTIDAELGFPPADRAALAGATGAHLNADVELSGVGEPQAIAAPGGGAHYRPITRLLVTLNDLGLPVPLGL